MTDRPHARALILSVEQRMALEEMLTLIERPMLPPTERREILSRHFHLIIEIIKRVMLFQRHAEEAVIFHDHADDEIKKLTGWSGSGSITADEELVRNLSKAWHLAGGHIEAIENGIGVVDLDWRRKIWCVVANVATQLTSQRFLQLIADLESMCRNSETIYEHTNISITTLRSIIERARS